MASFRLTLIFSALIALCAVLAAPASAQFGDLFRDPPPRPPADVPSRSPLPPSRGDVAPDRPSPPPMNMPPTARPGIQSQELPPPPGSISPQQPRVAPSAPQQASPAPGLPPGQRQPRGQPQPQQPPAATAPQPGDEIIVEPPAQKIANPQAVFAGLDKITGRIISFDVAIDETVQFGALQVTPRVCYTRPPTETQNTDAFIDVDEVTLQGETRRIFTGWMFASSPGLHAVEHPIYDVWLTDCKGGTPAVAEAPQAAAQQPAPQQQQPRRERSQQQQRRVTPQPPPPSMQPPPFLR